MITNGWWGEEMIGTPAALNGRRIRVPVGEFCSYCDTVIVNSDSGVTNPYVSMQGTVGSHMHQICAKYSVLGSRWCQAEGAQYKTPQHARYHQLFHEMSGLMRPDAVERRVLIEFNEWDGN